MYLIAQTICNNVNKYSYNIIRVSIYEITDVVVILDP